METQLNEKQEELNVTNVVLARLAQQNRVLELQIQEIKNSGNEKVWESCGKAFLGTPVKDYETKLNQQIKDNKDSVNSLEKKKHYLETTVKTTFDNMSKFLGPAPSSSTA
ncbi:hypothetical protein OGAPHI_003954 [Ogataea philodendri]|uniref:Prefoldin subunit 1 n=1 Tax=Ogataea philodendri TaxID=1378263 RepID=A0A9P8T5C4_9ASCO|nr:uncharacterized protein OGAPHI_003954 [Ogataea philodendri]KAH3665766.1 hypothetical protein OGAPHI_003954 [Ogataea philodendri]